MNKLNVKKVNIGQLGTLSIDVPVISLGSGTKRIVVLCGVHGDEKSGLFVVNQLLNELKGLSLKLEIVLAANPLAQALQQRVSPNDFHDLNRVFPGNVGTDFTQRLASKLLDLCKGADAVIDLHTFQDNAPVVAIFMNSGTELIRKKTLGLITAFNPDAVWQLDFTSKEEARLAGALGPVLANTGVPNFAVEMPECFAITDRQIEKVKDGLLRVINKIGTVGLSDKSEKPSFPILKRTKVRVNEAGLFIPAKKLLDKVHKGDEVGQLVKIPSFSSVSLTAPCEGVLMVIRTRDLVSTSDVVFSIGSKP